MQDKPTPSFSSFMRDTDGEYSKAVAFKTARALLAEGRRADRVELGMVFAAHELAIERGHGSRFLVNVRDWASSIIEGTKGALDQLEAEREHTSDVPKT